MTSHLIEVIGFVIMCLGAAGTGHNFGQQRLGVLLVFAVMWFVGGMAFVANDWVFSLWQKLL